MNVELLIYAYLAICTSIIIFNCVYAWVFRSRDRALARSSQRLEDTVAQQLRRVRTGAPVDGAHKAFLRKKLIRTVSLQAFDEALERLRKTEPAEVQRYILEIRPVFADLAVENRYHSPMKLTYFAYVIRKYRVIEGRPAPAIMALLTALLQEPSLYCRESALQAVYSSGDCGHVLRALRIVDENRQFHHAKLLTDGLLAFCGDRQALVQELLDSFDGFSASMRVVILDFIRFGGVDRKKELLLLLADQSSEDEVRFSCIRYFGKYPFRRAWPLLLDLVEHPRGRRWEYAAIAATALASYPGERTVAVLKRALSSPNWYVRFNAARSLERFQLTDLELRDVIESSDRYAREILLYQMDLKRAARRRKAAPV